MSDKNPKSKKKGIGEKAVRGLAWIYLAYGIEAASQIVSLAVLARMLQPADFGVLAIGLILTGLGENLFRTAMGASIVQRQGDLNKFLYVAWTTNIGMALAATVLLAGITPVVTSRVFDQPQATGAVLVMVSTILLHAIANPQNWVMIKQLERKKLFWINVSKHVSRAVISIGAAFWIRNYWALVIGIVASTVIEVIVSYALYWQKPRLEWDYARFKELYKFSGWLQVNSACKWMSRHFDSFVVGSLLGPVNLGFYNRALNLATLPKQQLTSVINRITFPLFAELQEDKEAVRRLFRRSMDLTVLTVFPLVALVLLFGEEIIRFVLGKQWLEAVGILQLLVVALSFRAIIEVFSPVFRGLGKSKLETYLSILRVGTTAVLLYPFVNWWGMEGAGWAVIVGGLVAIGPTLYCLKQICPLTWRDWLESPLICLIVLLPTGLGAKYLLPGVISVPGQLASIAVTLVFYLALLGLVYALFQKGPMVTAKLALEKLQRRRLASASIE